MTKAKKFKTGDKVWLLCAKTDCGDEPAIDVSSIGFLEAEILSFDAEDGLPGCWLSISEGNSKYDAWYEERFLLSKAEFEKHKQHFGK